MSDSKYKLYKSLLIHTNLLPVLLLDWDLSLGKIIKEAAKASIDIAMRGLYHIHDIAIVVSDKLIDIDILNATTDIYTRCLTIGM